MRIELKRIGVIVKFDHIGIVGLGLIGGSIARTLKSKDAAIRITVMSRNEDALAAALRDGVADEVTSTDWSLFATCDAVFICVPVDKIFENAERLAHTVRRDCIITDVGSVKAPVMQAVAGLDLCFIGGHPMAGSEKSGYAASVDYLFENAHYFLTPPENAHVYATEALRALIARLGAIPVTMCAEQHDRIVAAVSHGPHIAAAALVNTVAALDNSGGDLRTFSAGGFKDITRIASSDGALWRSICTENKLEVLSFLSMLQEQIEAFRSGLASGSELMLEGLFDRARDYRDSMSSSKRSKYADAFLIHMDVPDRPGSIATVATLLSANNINIKNIGIVHNREYHDGVLQIVLDSEDSRANAVTLLKEMNFKVYE